jgi:hypothetical protein
MLSSLLLLLAILVLSWRTLVELSTPSGMTLFALVSIALYYPLYFWSLRGMEVGALAAVTSGALLLAVRLEGEYRVRRALALGLVGAAGVLIRMDFAVLLAVLAVFAVYTAPRGRRLHTALAVGLSPFLALLFLELFRMSYYHELLPNTYYLKVTGVSLHERLSRGVETMLDTLERSLLWVVVSWLAALPVLRSGPSRQRRTLVLALLLVASQLLYSIYVGGDAWERAGFSNRYVTTVAPLFFLIPALALSHRRIALPVALLFAAFLFVTGQLPFFREWRQTSGLHVVDDKRMAKLGLRIREHTDPSTTIAVVWAGAVPYFALREAIDLLGKTEPVVAKSLPKVPFFPGHDKWDYEFSIGKMRPDLVLQIWGVDSPAFDARMRGWGYVKTREGFWLKAASRSKLLGSGRWRIS